MKLRKAAKWFVLLVLIVSGWWVAFEYWVLYSKTRARLPDLNDEERWTLVKQYRGKFDRQHGEMVARVFVYKRPYTEVPNDRHEVAQNRIDIHDQWGNRLTTFMWPGGNVEYAGGWCEILDLNNDGAKEFVLFDDLGSVRVVAYESGHLQFKKGFGLQNRVDSAGFQIGPLDLDGDGQLEFLEDDFFPHDANARVHAQVPRVKHWNPQNGFQDVSAHFPGYYEKVVIPEFRSRAASGSGDVRDVYLLAIQHIERDILKRSPTPTGLERELYPRR